jgi:glycerol-3-phosphate dehydrogenase subunit C
MYPLNPRDPSFFDSTKLLREFERIASVCNGCRLCFNYCDSFPTLFKRIDERGAVKLTLDDLREVSSKCFHCKMCYVNCPYVPPHEFMVDFSGLMEWAWLFFKAKEGLSLRDYLWEMLDAMRFARPLARALISRGREIMGMHREAPELPVADKGFRERFRPKRIDNPKAKVALFPTCLVENSFPEIGEDLVEVFNSLGIEVVVPDFVCCGAPMLDVGDAERLRKNAERNAEIMERMVKEGYDVVSPIPTCTLMLNEYPRVLGREVPRAHDAMEYLLKLVNEGKVQIKGKLEKSVAYHPPCHLKYLRVGYPGVRLMRSLGLKVETSNKGCSGMDGGWGLRNYETAKRVGSKMMDYFRESKADLLVTECPLAGLQIKRASGRQPLHPIQVLKEAMRNA